ncbi:unnamed protein product, partial [Rotaria sordida]
MTTEILYEKDIGRTKKLKTHTKWISLVIGMLIGLMLLMIFIVILLLLVPEFLKNINATLMPDYSRESGRITQIFVTNWMPNKGQSTKVINADEIARKLEVVYGIDPGSIYISTIAINNGETNADDHHQSHRKKRDIPTCNQLGSHRSIVEMNIDIVYP